MTDDVKRFFQNMLQRVSGLRCVMVTDRDGVPLVNLEKEKLSEIVMKPAFLSTFTLAAEQSNKLGLGKNRNIISVYADCIVIQMNKLPFVVTFIGTENCLNIGLILAMDQQIDTMLEELKTAVADS
ncbi:mitogen-activated protein kinase kinase 1-interacting protein 1 [Culex quinquefasciatus]|uniref:Mitogen-activated protein kinase kinase 1-interacting protein 1 n=4 Tax=Culex pipiens complex TaxID=518105 RepID=B0WQW5_CULQU|nr:ragulator complex protein LAMTOR3 homolog [Culex quinquefasciatus]XP_039450398.1 ragulator complex protein LAMTOR3 homolog [Culex pipiens pallens]EDS33045.1 mitogen-activated protein kinase kinase 1-interacting protein 1 [Culex quinquefasciatus]|eukprot:XP_001851099.1 mitogen-activated protein kinase kinase 1-interacting protein 1 [Culex quinquefasciatus]